MLEGGEFNLNVINDNVHTKQIITQSIHQIKTFKIIRTDPSIERPSHALNIQTAGH